MKNPIIVLFLTLIFVSCENEPPSIPSNPYPPDNSIVPTHVNFSWKCDDPEGDRLTYNIYIDDVCMPPNLTQPFYTADLIPGKTYRWYITVRDRDHSLQGPIWIFTTESIEQEEKRKGIEAKIIADEKLEIAAGTYKEYKIYINVGDKIHYEVTSDTQVNVWFMSDDQFWNFANNQGFEPNSEYSGRRIYDIVKDFSIRIKGYYYLVIDNTFSWFTSKTVTVKITLN